MSFYRIIDHTADLGIEVSGNTPEDVLARAAEALFDLLAERDGIREAESRVIRVDGEDPADLLVNFLRECLYLYSGEGFLIRTARVRIGEKTTLEAELRGEPYDPGRHRIRMEIKAVTWHCASLEEMPGGPAGWKGRVIFDV
ncbi:MAG: archease [Syntrophaceae bacterium]|nr:archease [Syntrophaceae bacterium]